jgi:hypothetical protein
MQGETKKRLEQLCKQASTEQDSYKLIELITEINALLEAKRLRVTAREAREERRIEPIGEQDSA